jgi:hypothetical protein
MTRRLECLLAQLLLAQLSPLTCPFLRAWLCATGQTISYAVAISNTEGNCKVDINSAELTLPGGLGTRALSCGSFIGAGETVQCTAETLTVTAALFNLGTLQASVIIETLPSAQQSTSVGPVSGGTSSATATVTAAVSTALASPISSCVQQNIQNLK